jgi:hypothetical protein
MFHKWQWKSPIGGLTKQLGPCFESKGKGPTWNLVQKTSQWKKQIWAFRSGVTQELQFDLAEWVWQRQGCILQEFFSITLQKKFTG